MLHWLAVRPEYQRCGLGRALALCVLRYHKEHGKTSVSLKTEAYRDAAIKLYKDIGFVMCGDQGRESLDVWNLRFIMSISWIQRKRRFSTLPIGLQWEPFNICQSESLLHWSLFVSSGYWKKKSTSLAEKNHGMI